MPRQKRYDFLRQGREPSPSIELLDNIHAPVDSESPAVERNVIILGASPFHVGVKPVIGRAPFILFADSLLGRLLALTVHIDNPFRTESHIRMNEYPKAVGLILEDVIRTATYDDARLLFCQFGDNSVLDAPEIIRVVGTSALMRKDIGQKAPGAYSPASRI